jgi:hypothetical protein
MIGLREDQAVATGDDAELDRRPPRLPVEQRPVPFERDPVEDPAAEAGVPCDPSVNAVGTDEHPTVNGRPADAKGCSVRSDR